MALKIGFGAEWTGTKTNTACTVQAQTATPRKSVVQVAFPDRGLTLAYYNDRFDLHCGDIVFVDGKLEGRRGRVVEVNYNFKIKLSDYKSVIAVADTDVHGRFYMAGSHFVTFDPSALPIRKAASWYMAPSKEDEVYTSGSDDNGFHLDDFTDFQVSEAVAARGRDCYMENKVAYICIDGNKGYAIVEGSKPYEVEFYYDNGEIGALVCSCFCAYNCKHEVAAMLQLRETMGLIDRQYAEQFKETNYFAAISKGILFAIAVEGKDTGSFTL